MKPKILSIDTANSILQQELEKNGCEFVPKPYWERADLLSELHNFDVLIVRSKVFIDREIIDSALKNLKIIARIGAGMDAIDVEYAQKCGIICLNSPEGNRDAVGEHAVALLLNLFNHINIADNQVRKGLWLREENRGIEVKNRTIGIIGYGNMGRAFAKKLSGFECKILVYDKYLQGFGDNFVQEAKNLKEIFENCDVLSLHIPLTEETKFMVNWAFIEQFFKPFYLINTARGKVLDTKALIKGLKMGKILGAGLDVLEFEAFNNELKISDNEDLDFLFSAQNVIFTPHVAGWTVESSYKLSHFLAQKILNNLSKMGLL
ncbi:MAG: hypothetical protein LBR17_05385 [Bacteroidales bacterium]|jgi:D-3-phosphoglycerate dehydrogenase|nr:hypothetical protein [Bacteroidales bacterium]